jgi:hypothetical protein
MDEFVGWGGVLMCTGGVRQWLSVDPWMLIMYVWVDSAHKLYITNAFVSR